MTTALGADTTAPPTLGTDGNFPVPQSPQALAFTGERMTGAISGQIEYEHLHRYCLARDYCAGRDVLDVASGEGYGAALLAGVARSVVGVELDADSVRHAAASYAAGAAHLRFEQGDALALPLDAASVDVMVSFETIEHLPDVSRFLDEVQRVLRPGGLLVISTPDRTVYSAPGSDPNPYHVLEMTGAEFRATLTARFANVAVAAQRPMLGSVMAAPGAAWRSFERRSLPRAEASAGLARAPYLIALASDAVLPTLPSSVYLDHRRVHDVVEAAAEAGPLRGEVARLTAALQDAWRHQATLEAEGEALRAERAGLIEQHAARVQEIEAREERLARQQDALAAADAGSAALRQELGTAALRTERLTQTVGQQERHVEHLQSLLAERAVEWERINQVLDGQAGELARSGAALRAVETHRDALLGSASWRVSRPVRTAGLGLRKAVHVARLPQRALSARALRARRRAEVEALRATPLFDAAWYLDHVPGLRQSGQDAAAHFAWIGAEAGAMPNAYFDTAWYRARHSAALAGAALDGENPLLHWVRVGAAQRLDPNPFFRTAWYVDRHPEAAADSLLHWIEHGVAAGLDPNPMLDAEGYLLEYPAARDSGLGALLHWWRHGAAAGYDPHPAFDSAFYRQRHGLPPGTDPLAHWLHGGEAEGLVTSALLERAGAPLAPLWFTPEPDPAVSIIIPAYGHYADTWRCLYAVMAGSGSDVRYEVIVVDDCPEHRVVPTLQRRAPGVRWLQNPENLGFLRSCNAAEKLATGAYLVFLNNDAEVHPGWLGPLAALAERDPAVGMVGCKLLNTDGTLQEAGGAILSNGWGEPYGAGADPDRAEYSFVRDVDVVVGACILVRRAAFEALGGFDLRYAPAFYEEFDLAFGLRRAGYRTLYQPASRVTHRGSNSYGSAMRDRQSLINHRKFCVKWHDVLAGQPVPDAPALLRRERPPRAGRVLVIDDRVLEWNRHAGALTIHLYIGLLRAEGYAVTYAAAADPRPLQPYMGEMQQDGVEMLLGADALTAWLGAHGGEIDAVWIARPGVAGPLLPMIRAATPAPILYYTHDLHYLRERRRWELEGDPAVLDESKRVMRIEHEIFGSVDQVMTPSLAEAHIIRAEMPGASVHVIPPYVVDAEAAAAAAVGPRDAVMFVGGFAHAPNVDAATWLITGIMPRVWAVAPEVRALIVGDAPPAGLRTLAGGQVEVTGFVEDLGPLYARAFCTVSCLRYGAGVKGKVIASIQARVPVVTTAIGNEGIDLQDGSEAMVGDTEEAIAAAVLALWTQPGLRDRIAEAGLRRVRDGYSVQAATAALRAVLDAAKAVSARHGLSGGAAGDG